MERTAKRSAAGEVPCHIVKNTSPRRGRALSPRRGRLSASETGEVYSKGTSHRLVPLFCALFKHGTFTTLQHACFLFGLGEAGVEAFETLLHQAIIDHQGGADA